MKYVSTVCDELLAHYEERAKLPDTDKRRIRKGSLIQARTYLPKTGEAFAAVDVGNMSDDPYEGHWAMFCEGYKAARDQELERKKVDPSLRVRGAGLYGYWKFLNSVMKYAIEKGYRTAPWNVQNPDQKVKQRKLTKEEVKLLLTYSDGDMYLQILWAATMGCRKSEMMRQVFYYRPSYGCRSSDDYCHISFQQDTMTVCASHAKSERSVRTIPLNKQVRDFLHLRFARSGNAIFPAREDPDQPLDFNYYEWEQIKKRAGIKDPCKFHLLRHYYLTEVAKQVKEGGVSTEMVCAYAGLTEKVFRDNYLHLDANDLKAVTNLVTVNL